MNPEQLLQHFERISEAPDAIPRLRRFILDLAVRGKLVEQDPNDESVVCLLAINDRERQDKSKLDHRADLEQQELLAEEHRWAVPSSWAWRGLADIVLFIDYRGKTPTKTAAGVRLITAKNVKQGYINLSPDEFLAEPDYQKWMTRGVPKIGDVLFTTEAPMGNAAVVRLSDKFALAQRVICFRPYTQLNSDFLVLQLLAQPFQFILDKTATGLTAKGIKAAKLKRLPIAIPPLAEQHRIVAKVDELMALCDQLQAAQTEREQSRDRLVAASLHSLNPPADDEAANAPETQREHARFIFNHLPRLTTRPTHIKQLRQTILNLAVRGKLTAPENRPLQQEPLQKFATLQNGYAFKSEWFVSGGIRLLRNANVSHGFLRWDEMVSLPEHRATEFERFKLEEGDVVLSLDRPFIVTGTKVARVRQIDLPCLLLQRVGRFQTKNDLIDKDYLFLWLHSPHFTEQIDPGRSNGVPLISSKQVEATEIFVPPLAEQHRIVAKVDELMALCDQLETQLSNTAADSRRLLEAILHEALLPAIEKAA